MQGLWWRHVAFVIMDGIGLNARIVVEVAFVTMGGGCLNARINCVGGSICM